MTTNILEYLEATAERIPDSPAFSDEKLTLSFLEFLKRSRAVGSFLIGKGVKRRSPVMVIMNKKPDTIAVFFGVVYAGCFYVPIDPDMPPDRVKLITAKLDPQCVFTDKKNFDPEKYGLTCPVFEPDEAESAPLMEEGLRAVRDTSIDTDPIYVVFTSGSTGIPKGVLACHSSVIDYAEAFTGMLKPSVSSVFGMQVPLYVDACLKEILSTIKCGSHTWLIPRSMFMFPVRLVEYLNRHEINTLCWVVSALTIISGLGTFETIRPSHLSTVCFGSEVFPVRQLALWREVLPECRFINLYGPTEATGMSSYYELPKDRIFGPDDRIPVGKPFKNTRIFLLDDDDKEAIEGEICITGRCLTLGYFRDEERTAKAFTQNPLNHDCHELIYRTGDIGRYDENGDLVFVSRKDSQIKHMGHRIELGEIEQNAGMLEGISSQCCVYDDIRNRIVLYYTGEAEPKDIMMSLKSKLPSYMLPSKLEKLKVMPVTNNGKIDRSSLRNKAKEEE
ncbi:MAG: amino acid adenylation domain-containing protein [Christensenellaceae bacterium]|nr:amino acid adenylation domain-containing protein [Christensenellaceae bacterium]